MRKTFKLYSTPSVVYYGRVVQWSLLDVLKNVLKVEKASYLKLSDVINPIIISDDGSLFPFCHGMNDYYKIANINNNVGEQLANWKEKEWYRIQKVIKSSFDKLESHKEDYIDWFFHILQTSDSLVP